MRRHWRRCGTRSRRASTGSIRPPCTGSGTRRRSSGSCFVSCRLPTAPSCSRNAVSCGTRTIAWPLRRRVLTPESIRQECEASLRRLGVERIDLYQFHWPDETGTSDRGLVGRDDEAHRAGKDPRRRRLEFRCAPARSMRSHPARRLAAAAVLADQSRRRGERASVVREPRHRRHLLQPDAVRPADRELHGRARVGARRATTGGGARRSSNSRTCGGTWRCATRCARSRNATSTSVSAVAIAWTLAWPGVTGAIVGARTPAQVDGWIDAASITLTAGGPRRDRGRDPANRGRLGPCAGWPAARVRAEGRAIVAAP